MSTAHGSLSSQAATRLQGGQLILKGYDNDAIVDIAEVSVSSVKNWRRKLKQSNGELQSLARQKGSGRHAKLNDVQKQKLKDIVLDGAVAAGFPDERWTSKRVADVIRRVFHIAFAPSSVRRLLRDLGLSPQMPVVKLHKYSEVAALEWATQTWKRLKKSEETRHPFDFP